MIQGLPLIASLAGQAQPPKRKRSFFAGLYDKLSPSDDPTLTDEQREALGRQGLLNLGLGMLQTGGQGFGGAFANGLQSGLLSMREGTQDIANQRYKDEILARTRQGMERNTAIEQAMEGVLNPDGTINDERWGNLARIAPDQALEVREKAAPKGRKNPGQPVYLASADGKYEDPYFWDESVGSLVPAESFLGGGAPVIGGDGFLAGAPAPQAPALGADMLPQLEQAVMHVESRGNPNAVSPKGAIGTMQTMPGTLRDPGYGVAPARDNSPQELERVGKDYLAAMLRQYGDPRLALAAYNWGPGNVDAALRSGKTPEEVIASAPKETREYVPKVLGQLDAPSPMRSRLGRRPKKGDDMMGSIPAGYRLAADGRSLEPVPGGPADRKANPTASDLAKGEQSMRKELQDKIQDDRASISAYRNLESQSAGGGISDAALIIGYMKTLDPTSVVRESEFATIQNATGLDERLRSYIKRTVNGDKLTEEQRREILRSAKAYADQASSRVSAETRAQQSYAEEYGYDPRRSSGMADFRDVTVNVLSGSREPRAAAGGPQPGSVEGGYRFRGGNPADPNSWEKL